jgi:hypothetical protein
MDVCEDSHFCAVFRPKGRSHRGMRVRSPRKAVLHDHANYLNRYQLIYTLSCGSNFAHR